MKDCSVFKGQWMSVLGTCCRRAKGHQTERQLEEKNGCRLSFPAYLALLAGASFWSGSVLVLHLGSSANHCPSVSAFPFCVPKDP